MSISFRNLYKNSVYYIVFITLICSVEIIYKDFYGLYINIFLLFLFSIIMLFVFLQKGINFNKRIFITLMFYFIWISIVNIYNSGATIIFDVVHIFYLLLFVVFLPTLNENIKVNLKLLRSIGIILFIPTLYFMIINLKFINFSSNIIMSNSLKLTYNEIFYNINIDGYVIYYSAVVFLILYILYKTKIYLIAFIFSLIVLFITGVRAAIISLVIFIGLLIVFKYWKVKKYKIFIFFIINFIIFIFFLALISFITNFNISEFNELSSGRIGIWVDAFQKVNQTYIFGNGIRGWGETLGNEHWNPHNYILTIILSYGLIGLILYHFFLLIIFMKSFKLYKNININNISGKLLVCLMALNLAQIFMFLTNVGFYGSYNLESIFYIIFLTLLINTNNCIINSNELYVNNCLKD